LISKRQPLLIPTKQLIQDLNWIIENPSLLNLEVLNEIELKPLSDAQELRIIQLGSLEIKSFKLGFYFEALIRLWIQVSEIYTLKAANLQVQNNQQTQGEFDFIVENLEAQKFEHWEVSIKFYLCHQPQLELEGCWGTQLKDVFQGKVSKLKNQQLQLGKSQNGIETLKEIGVNSTESRGLLKGMLFYNGKLGQFENVHLNPFSNKGIWMFHSEWTSISEGSFIVLKKPFLFSLNSYSENDVLTKNDVLKLSEIQKQPLMLALVEPVESKIIETSRIWLIPDNLLIQELHLDRYSTSNL
jgi:hypothetical protein